MIIGELTDIGYRFQDGTYNVNVRCEQIPQELNNLVGKRVKCEIKKFSAARSLNANALFHLIVGIIANNINASAVFVKNKLLSDYGQLDGGKSIFVRSDIDVMEFDGLHLRASGNMVEDKGQTYAEFYIVRGSHTYDSREMSILIEGAKYELKALGVAMPISDQEVERILGKWQKS